VLSESGPPSMLSTPSTRFVVKRAFQGDHMERFARRPSQCRCSAEFDPLDSLEPIKLLS